VNPTNAMYAKGHFGLTLALSSLLMVPFGNGYETTVFIMVATMLASLPDIDMSLKRKGVPIHHRGPTHSLLFAIICGVLLSGVMFYLYKTLIYIAVGFFAGVSGIMTHLLGDMLTYMAFKPLWPFRDNEVSYGLFAASNKEANNAMLILGTICFVLYAM